MSARDSHTATVDSWAEYAEAVKTGWALALHCGQPECEDDIKAATSATPRCIRAEGAAEEGMCVRCDRKSAYGKRLIFGRAYWTGSWHHAGPVVRWQRRKAASHTGVMLLRVPADPLRPRRRDEHFAAEHRAAGNAEEGTSQP